MTDSLQVNTPAVQVHLWAYPAASVRLTGLAPAVRPVPPLVPQHSCPHHGHRTVKMTLDWPMNVRSRKHKNVLHLATSSQKATHNYPGIPPQSTALGMYGFL